MFNKLYHKGLVLNCEHVVVDQRLRCFVLGIVLYLIQGRVGEETPEVEIKDPKRAAGKQ